MTKPAQTTSMRQRLPFTHRRLSACARLTALAVLCLFALAAAPISSASASFVWGDAHQLDLGQTITDMSCPMTTQCTVVGNSNDETTFDPQTAGTVNAFPIASGGDYRGVSCPSVNQCTAVGGGTEVTFDPIPVNPPNTPMHATVDTGADLASVSCPTANQCVAVDGSSGDEVTFNPTTGDAQTPAPVDVGHGDLTSVTCLTITTCVAVDSAGYEATFSATTGVASTQEVGLTGDFIPSLSDVTCQVLPSTAVQCSASASNGSVTTFDPSAASSPNRQFLSAAGQSGMACPTATVCITALAHTGLVSFNPHGGGRPPLTSLGVLGQGPIVCVSANQCTTSNGVGATTFDPTDPAIVTDVSFAPAVTGISCPSAAACRFGDLGGNLMLAQPSSLGPSLTAVSGGSILAISCPTSLGCTAAQANGQLRNFAFASDGETTGTSTFVTGSAELTAIDCPTITVCSIGESNGSARTYNSQTMTVSNASSGLDPNHAILSISCPDGTHCVAVDAAGAETSYNPQNLTSPHAPLTVDPGNALVAVSCPSDTQCTAVDGAGQQVTFNPLTTTGAPPVSIDPGNALSAIACPETTECVAVDNAGESLTGNPQVAAPWDIEPIPGTSALTGISCVSDDSCSAIDSDGEYSLGAFVAAPVSSTAPTVSGAAVVGQTLTETHAGWSGTPTAYSYQWEDCDANGLNCAPIANATGQSYTLAAVDAVHTIRVIETASNAGGSSAPATSDPTAVVTVPSIPTPPTTTPPKPVAKQHPPEPAQVKAALRKVLAPAGTRAGIKALLKAGGYSFVFHAPSAGKLALDWYQLPKGARLKATNAARTAPKPVLVASVTAKIHKAGKIKLKIKLSRAGREQLKSAARSLKLTAQGSFMPSGAKRTTARRTFSVLR